MNALPIPTNKSQFFDSDSVPTNLCARLKYLFPKIKQKSYRILLIEDDPIVRRVHFSFLKLMGLDVDIARAAQEALAKYQDGYDLIILDAGLPDMTGFELAQIIRKTESVNVRYKLIMLSAYNYEFIKTNCETSNIDDFATKPIQFEAFCTLIKKWINK